MRPPKSLARLPDVELDLTPMIDCVFQLVIFFALVNEFTTADMKKAVLPAGPRSVRESRAPEDADHLVVTVVDPSAPPPGFDPSRPPVYYRGVQPADMRALRARLRADADPLGSPTMASSRRRGLGLRPSRRTLRIRGDRAISFGWVQAVVAWRGPIRAPLRNPRRSNVRFCTRSKLGPPPFGGTSG
jgi:hypothetical protein